MNNKITFLQCGIFLVFIAVMVLLSFLSLSLSGPASGLLLKEGGVVESASALGYSFCIAFLLYMGTKSTLKSHWYMHVIFLAMAFRELDFDKRFTSTGVLKSKFIVAEDVGLTAKVIGMSAVLILLASVFIWARRHAREFFSGVFKLQASSWAAGFAMFFVLFTKSIDGLARKLEPFGIEVSTNIQLLAGRTEEIFELGIPITLLYAIFLYWRSFKAPQN